ncbi:hypothetical protein [Sphaerisporangium corydalis]|uniref:Uncharacterized protein n=1 Tax=Sphaerisporangium corydalis TaxID=1441875 RepID=A0ABV9EQI8_9ACTN|nr:hypothetical protein [Sphaerisporangium corydalis]
MTLTRTLTGLAVTAALVALVPAAAQAAAGPSDTAAATSSASASHWGTYYAPGHRAKTFGSLSARGEDHDVIPTADTVRISGKVYDLTRRSSSCGLAVFRITYRDHAGKLPFKHRTITDCSYGTAKPYSFSYHDVYEVELKVCSEAKAAKPSLNCLYAGTWKVLYLSK